MTNLTYPNYKWRHLGGREGQMKDAIELNYGNCSIDLDTS